MFCSQEGHPADQTRLLRILSSQHLKISKHGDCTTSLGHLCHCPHGGKKNNPYIQSEPPISTCACCLSGALHSCEGSECLLSDLPTGAGSCRDIPQSWLSLAPSSLSSQDNYSCPHHLVGLSWNLSSLSMSFLEWRFAHWGARRSLASSVCATETVSTRSWSGAVALGVCKPMCHQRHSRWSYWARWLSKPSCWRPPYCAYMYISIHRYR